MHQEPADPRLWPFCPLGGETEKLKHQICLHNMQENPWFLSLIASKTSFIFTVPYTLGTSLLLLHSAN